MSIIIGILTFLEVIVCLLLSLLVLMQKPRQEGLGAAFGGGIMDSLAGAQTTNVLQKGTVYFGVALFALTFLLAVLTSHMDQHQTSAQLVNQADLNKAKAEAPAATPEKKDDKSAAPAPAATTTPATAPEASKPAETKPSAGAKPEATPPAAAPAPAPSPAPEAAKPAEAKPAEAKPADATPAPAPTPEPAKK